MFSTLFITVLSATALVSARMDSRSESRRSEAPSHYAEGYLERYDVYHARYVALDCKAKHQTSFFDKCCHPMLAKETLAKDRAPECNPANIKPASSKAVSSVAPKATKAPTNNNNDDEYCEEGDEDCECEDEGDDEDECEEGDPDCVCESEGEESSPKPVASSSKKPAPSSSKKPAPSSTKKAASQPKPTGQTRTGGVATYFYQGGNAGACGIKHKDSDFVAALDSNLYGNLGKASQYCGRKILITRTDTGKTVQVTVADACPSCINTNSIDLSVAAFKAIATTAEGQVPISWQWM